MSQLVNEGVRCSERSFSPVNREKDAEIENRFLNLKAAVRQGNACSNLLREKTALCNVPCN